MSSSTDEVRYLQRQPNYKKIEHIIHDWKTLRSSKSFFRRIFGKENEDEKETCQAKEKLQKENTDRKHEEMQKLGMLEQKLKQLKYQNKDGNKKEEIEQQKQKSRNQEEDSRIEK